MKTQVLVVSTVERRQRLLPVLERNELEISVASSLEEARQKLSGSTPYDLLLVDAEQSDGSWMDLLQFVENEGKSCEVIVFARCGDERLWAEVLQSGAHDLLVEPYEQQDVPRVIEGALQNQSTRSERNARQ
ncbi:MAG: response regulator [Acidobacteria bacterium]|nr:response regulator [Acidobacteriota bacterium]